MSSKSCPLCKSSFASEEGLEAHVEKKHPEQLEGMSAARYLFNLRNRKTEGLCIMRKRVPSCRKTTEFNEKAKRYNRLCGNAACKTAYVEEFRKRMLRKYGKEHLLDDPEVQKAMLSNRSISDTYKFRDGAKFVYTGKYEAEFLEYMDLALEWPSEDLTGPAPFVLPFTYDGNQVFYIPDFYVPSLDLIVEIKGTNAHYQAREKAKEAAKDNVARGSGHNFIKILDRNYDRFLEGLMEGRWKVPVSQEKQITVNEAALIACDPVALLEGMGLLNESVPEDGEIVDEEIMPSGRGSDWTIPED